MVGKSSYLNQTRIFIQSHSLLSAFKRNTIYKKIGLIPEMIDVAPPRVLRIVYRNNNILAKNNMGKENMPTQVTQSTHLI